MPKIPCAEFELTVHEPVLLANGPAVFDDWADALSPEQRQVLKRPTDARIRLTLRQVFCEALTELMGKDLKSKPALLGHGIYRRICAIPFVHLGGGSGGVGSRVCK
jgi:hypothetical protein